MARPVTLPKVVKQLTEPMRAPLCDLPSRQDYAAEEIKASLACWRASFGDAAHRYDSLRSAVRAREIAAASMRNSK